MEELWDKICDEVQDARPDLDQNGDEFDGLVQTQFKPLEEAFYDQQTGTEATTDGDEPDQEECDSSGAEEVDVLAGSDQLNLFV